MSGYEKISDYAREKMSSYTRHNMIINWIIVVSTTVFSFGILVASILSVSALNFGTELGKQSLNAAMVVVGMLTMVCISVFFRYLENHQRPTADQISFDESKARIFLSNVTAADYEYMTLKSASYVDLPEISSSELLEQDPNLALAKLRIDIERELRKFVIDRELVISTQRVSVNTLLSLLAKQGFIGPAFLYSLENVLSVCNEAIHGGSVTQEVARSVLSVGQDLLKVLRSRALDSVS